MTTMPTIISIALGLTPVPSDGTVKLVNAQTEQLIGRYEETVDDTGTTHLRGYDRQSGRPYHITVNPYGRVEGSVGDWVVTFNVRDAA